MMYAIINHKTEKFVYGTDYRYNPPHQRTSFNKMITFSSRKEAETEMGLRKCNDDYCVVGIGDVVEIRCDGDVIFIICRGTHT